MLWIAAILVGWVVVDAVVVAVVARTAAARRDPAVVALPPLRSAAGQTGNTADRGSVRQRTR